MIKLAISFTLLVTVFGAPPPTQPGKVIAIVRSNSEIAPDGTGYKYGYETENGISVEETGSLAGSGTEAALIAVGSYKYISPEGVPVDVVYEAGLEGFQAKGSVIPTPPPTPEPILRALAYNEAHPEPESSKSGGGSGFILTSF